MKVQIKEPARLREKKLANGNKSLYLDIYINGRREYEFLKLYLIPENNKEARERNRETLQLANSIKIARITEINNNRFNSSFGCNKDTMFVPYAEYVRDETTRGGESGYISSWNGCIPHLRRYCNNDKITFRQIDEQFCEGFKSYLDTVAARHNGLKLLPNTKHLYMAILRVIIRHAVKDHILPHNVMANVKLPPREAEEREYLTIEELQTLAQTPCRYDVLKRAFLFSCLTGLRWSDVCKLKWSDVQLFNGRTRITFRQQKTQRQEYLDINGQAAELFGTRDETIKDERIFHGIMHNGYANTLLQQWIYSAGIQKHITFHCARHTFAVMMLNLGTDLYTVSKLLGHTKITTTQIYAKIVDKTKQDAIDRIPQGIIQM